MVRQAVAVRVLDREAPQRGLDDRPCLGDERVVVEQHHVAPHLEGELGREVDPAVDVLEAIAVGPDEGVLVRAAHVVRDRERRLAHARQARRLDRHGCRVGPGHRREEVADPAPLEVREQLDHRRGCVEVDVDGVVERVVEALEEREPAGIVRVRLGAADLARLPERPAVDEEVQLVEQRRLGTTRGAIRPRQPAAARPRSRPARPASP